MTRTPDEIKKGLAYCVEPYCPGEKCPYWNAESCAQDKTYDALAYIQQLEERNKQLHELLEGAFRLNGELHHDMLEQRERADKLEAERDAAIADMTEMAKYGGENACEWCDQTECECTCREVGIYAGFNWRGVQKED